jgi:hypothetical protein
MVYMSPALPQLASEEELGEDKGDSQGSTTPVGCGGGRGLVEIVCVCPRCAIGQAIIADFVAILGGIPIDICTTLSNDGTLRRLDYRASRVVVLCWIDHTD